MNAAERTEWLAWRRTGIGASDVAGILGISPYANQTPLAIYLDKIGEAPEVETTERMLMGNLLEPVILRMYEERTGERLTGFQQRAVHPMLPFIRATLDAVNYLGHTVQAKNVGFEVAANWGEEGTDQVPDTVACQVHTEMLAFGTDRAIIPILIGGNEFRVYEVARDAEIQDTLIDKLSEFWRRVELRDPPPATLPADAEMIRKMRPKFSATIELSEQILELVDRWEDHKSRVREDSKLADEYKASIIQAMDGHACAQLPNGRLITRKEIFRKGFTVDPTSYFDFRVK